MKNIRDEALYAQFKKIWRDNPSLPFNEVIKLVLKSPQPRLWVSFYGVYRILQKILYGSRRGPKRKSRRGLEEEIERKYRALKRQPIFRDASAYFLASFIIAEPSRGFYLSEASAYRIILRIQKKHRARKK